MRKFLSPQPIKVLSKGGLPGYFLIGYWAVQAVFTRGKIDASAIDTTAIIFMFYSFICFGVGLNFLFFKKGILTNFENRIIFNSPIIWFILYSALGLISAFWSIQFELTIYRAFESISMLLLMIATLKELHSKGMKMVIQWTLIYVFSIIIIRFLQYLFRGASLEFSIGNGGIFQCAQMIAPVFFFLGVLHARKWYIRWTFIAFSILSMSTTGYLGIALGLSALAFGNNKIRALATLLFSGLLLLAIILGPESLLKNTVFIEKPSIDMEHTSGRDQVWKMGFDWFKEKPLTGYGFVAGETYLIRNGEGRTYVIGMHNSIMSALVGEGIFGAAFLVLFFLGMFLITFSRYMPLKYRPALIAIFLSAFVQSMGNPGIGFRVYGSWMSAMYVCVLIASIYTRNKYYNESLKKYYYGELLKIVKPTTYSTIEKEYENNLGNT